MSPLIAAPVAHLIAAIPAAAMQEEEQAEQLDPALVDACGEDPGLACEWVLEQSDNAGLAKVVDFLVAKPLNILIIVVVALVAARLARRFIRRFAARMGDAAEEGRLRRWRRGAPGVLKTQETTSVRSAARAETISGVLSSVVTIIIYTLAGVYILAELGVNLGPLVAGAGFAGAALGFGAQSLVRDFLSGIFMLIEDQYGVGDVVDVGEAIGTVESVSLRTTRLRGIDGTVWHVPNGSIPRVGNSSQQWARALLDVVVAHGTDAAAAVETMTAVANEVCEAPEQRVDVLEDPEVWGVERLGPEGVTLRLVVKTRPGTQWRVMRALRQAIQERFEELGIKMPLPFVMSVAGGEQGGSSAPKPA